MARAIALDATYSLGDRLTGVGIYCQEMLRGLAAADPDRQFEFCYRSHRLSDSFRSPLPSANCTRRLLTDYGVLPFSTHGVFHGLNQRMPRKRMRRSVCTFHDLFVMTGEYSSSEFRVRFTQQAREAAERADLIIAVSAFTANQVQTMLGVEAARVRVIHHGVRTLALRESSRLPVILSVGAIQFRKNTTRLVRAFESVGSEWRLVLAGSPDGFGSDAAMAAISSSPARDRIEVTGYVSPERLAELYSSASVFAFPSLDEGFGMPVLEAMNAGVPVLASDRSALPEVCGEAALLVDANSEEAIGDGLRTLTEDEGLRHNLVRRGRERASMFNWRAAVEKTWSVYRQLGIEG